MILQQISCFMKRRRRLLLRNFNSFKWINFSFQLPKLWKKLTKLFAFNSFVKRTTFNNGQFHVGFFKNGPFSASFLYFRLFYIQIRINFFNKSCRYLDSNPGPLLSKLTALSFVPQLLPGFWFFYSFYSINLQIYQSIYIFLYLNLQIYPSIYQYSIAADPGAGIGLVSIENILQSPRIKAWLVPHTYTYPFVHCKE